MRNIIIFFLLGTLFFVNSLAYTAESEFKKNNPDGGKYEFARSYIPALSYFNAINQRWNLHPPKKKFPKDDFKVIRTSMEYLVLDNADLRVAKNYMRRYLSSPNSMIRKIADMIIVACDQDIALNNQEKRLWADWLIKKTSGQATSEDEKNFIKAQRDVEYKRKASDASIIQASFLMTRVLLSESNPDEKGHALAITQKQRDKLIEALDVYGKEVLDWGPKSGQSTLAASIAVIREVLEDPVYIAHK